MPSNQRNRAVAPTFFIEAKVHTGSVPVARRQAFYDGALEARAMHSLQLFADESQNRHDDKAYTMTSTSHTGTLAIYATNPTRSSNNNNSDRHTDYVVTQIGRWSLDGSPESYQQGLKCLSKWQRPGQRI
ncbi:hypothetical protein BDW68DRAFT_130159 [Aspergillus falconensis]